MTNRTNRLAYDPGGLLSERSLARAAATPLELRDFLDEPAASRRRAERFAEDSNPENWRRATILPFEENTVTGEVKWAVPGLLKGAFDSGVQAVTLPGRAMRGEVQLTDANGNVSQDAIAESLNFAGWALPVSSASRVGAKATARSSQTRGLSEWRPNGTQAAMKEVEIDPPVLPQRPFRDDYPNGALTDRAGKILEDVDGRKLHGGVVAGRRWEGQPDIALDHRADGRVAERLMKKSISWYRANKSTAIMAFLVSSWGRTGSCTRVSEWRTTFMRTTFAAYWAMKQGTSSTILPVSQPTGWRRSLG